PEHADVPRRGGEAAQPRKNGVGSDAPDHRLDPADPVAQPTEEDATRSGADEEGGDDAGEPRSDVGVGSRGAEQLLEGGTAGEREETHLQAVEHPAEKGGHEGHRAAFGIRLLWGAHMGPVLSHLAPHRPTLWNGGPTGT